MLFFGVGDDKLQLLKSAFPKVKFIARGLELKIKGDNGSVEQAYDAVRAMLHHLASKGKLSVNDVESILSGEKEMTPSTRGEKSKEVPDKDLILYGARGNMITAKSPNQRAMVEAAVKNDIVFAIGPAGTGKTYTAVAIAVQALKTKRVKKIVLVRPAVEAGESLGFLPGDLKEKIDPYLRPLYDALEDMIDADKLRMYQENNTVEIVPLAYMRGRTLNSSYVILDEAQNATPLQLKMFLTRLGGDSKAIITGDITQIDLPKHQVSGLIHAQKLLQGIDGLAFIYLDHRDVIRHPLVKKILKAYEDDDSNSH